TRPRHTRHLHSFPTRRSSDLLAKELKDAGFEVTENVGGHGVVAVLKNGKGPTVLVRADMDALPIVERTGLPYASKVRTRGPTGEDRKSTRLNSSHVAISYAVF